MKLLWDFYGDINENFDGNFYENFDGNFDGNFNENFNGNFVGMMGFFYENVYGNFDGNFDGNLMGILMIDSMTVLTVSCLSRSFALIALALFFHLFAPKKR